MRLWKKDKNNTETQSLKIKISVPPYLCSERCLSLVSQKSLTQF